MLRRSRRSAASQPFHRFARRLRLERLEDRTLLAVASPVGQLIYLDFTGATGVTYDGPVRVGPLDVPAFSAAGVGLGGQEELVIEATLSGLRQRLAGAGVQLTRDRPAVGEFSTVYVGGSDTAFAAYGSFSGLAEAVDHGNRVRTDEAFVFSDEIRLNAPTVAGYAAALAEVIGHEVGHLLGAEHAHGAGELGPLGGVAYAQGAGNPVHQFLSRQGFRLFNDQFKPSDLTDDKEDSFADGAFAEDENGANPWAEGADVGALNSPSLRHFWAHDALFNRDPLDGLLRYDSAVNRSYKYFTGGAGFEGQDGDWGGGSARLRGYGIVRAYQNGATDLAFEYLGHVAHLLQDMTVPVHAHADPHLELLGLGVDPDPFHDWVDGLAFSSSLLNNPRRIASFDEAAGARWATYGTASLSQSQDLRPPQALGSITAGSGAVISTSDPLYRLFLETASLADNYDTKGYFGQLDLGGRGFHEEAELDPQGFPTGNTIRVASYRDFSRDELDSMARILVPRAATATAELLRYFYATVDAEKPIVQLPRFCSTDPANPQVLADLRVELLAVASDQIVPDPDNAEQFIESEVDSGVGKDLFKFEYAEVDPAAPPPPGGPVVWKELIQGGFGSHFTDGEAYGPAFVGKGGASSVAVLSGEKGKVYALRVTAIDGAGNEGQSKVYYVRVGEQPAVSLVTVIDVSGSMDGDPLEEAKSSAQAQIALLKELDRVGVVSFSSTASTLFGLTTIVAGSNVREQAQAAIDPLVAEGTTSIGAGLLLAYQMLGAGQPMTNPEDCTGKRIIVLLSDGMENTSPYAQDVINSIGDPSIVLSTVALGSGADEDLLQQLASSRGGEYFFAEDSSDLMDIYVRLAGSAADEQDVLRQRGSIGTGQQVSSSFLVDGAASQLTVGIQWPGSDLDLTLVAPDGTVFNSTTTDPRVRFVGGPTGEFFRIDNPQPGTWQVVTLGVQTEDSGEQFEVFARLTSPLKASIVGDPTDLQVGDRPFLLVRLTEGGPILGASVTGTVRPLDGPGRARSLAFFDDGRHGDGAANDGLYGADFVAGSAGAGSYELLVQAQGRAPDGRSFVRSPSRMFVVTGDGTAESQTDAVGVFDPSAAVWYFRHSTSSGPADLNPFAFGGVGWVGVVGDWDGNGTSSIGVIDNTGAAQPALVWYLRNNNSSGAPHYPAFAFGLPGWIPVVGDWDGNGTVTIGAFDPATATWYLRNSNSAGSADVVFGYGGVGWLPVVGDWDGDGLDTVGVVDPTGTDEDALGTALVWYLRDSSSPGEPSLDPFRYGGVGWRPLSGDWDGDGIATVGVVEGTGLGLGELTWYLRNSNEEGDPDIASFGFGLPSWQPLVGFFLGSEATSSQGRTGSVGVFDPSAATWYLRTDSASGAQDLPPFAFGGVGWVGVVGDWDGDGTATVGAVDGTVAGSELVWYLRGSNTTGAPDVTPFPFGLAGWLPVVGDWDGDGTDTVGGFDPSTGTWYLRNSNSAGAPDVVIRYGGIGWLPVVGDWDGDGTTTAGAYNPASSTWYLRNSNSAGAPSVEPFGFGGVGWRPISGDWNGDGVATVGVVDGGAEGLGGLAWYLRNSHSAGAPDVDVFLFGLPSWQPQGGLARGGA